MSAKKTIVQRLDLGRFTIIKPGPSRQPGKIWIEHRSGEAGEFSEVLLKKEVSRFFRKHF
jgi:hypothetical protein